MDEARDITDSRPHNGTGVVPMSETIESGKADSETTSPVSTGKRNGPFAAGQWVQLTDEKGRMHTIELQEKGFFQCHQGSLRHSAIIGKEEGSIIDTIEGRHRFTALRPLLADYHLSMPRGAQIVYPKDSAQIVMEGDIYPGATVVEAGVGSGALSMALLNAVGADGKLISVEVREEFADIARANVRLWFGKTPSQWQLELGYLAAVLAQKVPDHSVDRVVLDMLAPWENLSEVRRVLRPGGVLICYVATVTQLARLVQDVRAEQCFTALRSWENTVRQWHVDGLAVRPEHRMVAHTGFLFSARRLAPGFLPSRRGEEAVGELSPQDAPWLVPDEQWQAQALGQRKISDKKLRKVRRDVTKRVQRNLDNSEQ